MWNRDISFSPDGQTLAIASYDKKIRLWSLDGKLLDTLTSHGSWVSSISFSPTGDLLASGSGDRTIKLWQLERKSDGTLDGTLLLTLASHNNGVLDVAFAPNTEQSGNEQLLSGSSDGTAIVWTLEKDLPSLMNHGCDWARFYLENNSELKERDRVSCSNIDISAPSTQ